MGIVELMSCVVYANCPECDRQCSIKICYGNEYDAVSYDLNNLYTFSSLSDKEIEEIKEYIMEEEFKCSKDTDFDEWHTSCDIYFNPLKRTVNKIDRVKNILFGED